MTNLFAQRMGYTKESFIREILKVTKDPAIISFAGGLPNPKFFPVEEITEATTKLLLEDGHVALQYSTTEGYYPLRCYIAARYQQQYGLEINPDEILITNGSQQGLDLIGKIFLDRGDDIILERPGYLGAIQAFSLYEPTCHAIPLLPDGIDLEPFEEALTHYPVKLFYTVSNFQNPSGVSYSAAKRQAVAVAVAQTNTIIVEDNPYGELRFSGQDTPLIKQHLPEQTVLLGSFSKVVAPGLRLGWICAPEAIMQKLIIAKQAADLHSNYLAQRIVYQYVTDNDLDSHLEVIRHAYKQQRDRMASLIETLFPPETSYIKTEGGMFLWVTLPEGFSSMALFEQAIQENVAFVPGHPFYVDGGGDRTLRLNFSNANIEQIEMGMERLAHALKTLQ